MTVGYVCFLLVLSAFAQDGNILSSPVKQDFTTYVQAQLEERIANTMQISPEKVHVVSLGLANTNTCSVFDRVDLFIPNNEDFRGRTTVQIQGWNAGVGCGRWTTQAEVEIHKELYVSDSTYQIGDVVHMHIKEVRWDLLTYDPIDGTYMGKQWEARTVIHTGEVVLRTQLRQKPDKVTGESVVIVYKSTGLQIRSDGRMIKDAFIGERVKVMSLSTNVLVEGVLEADGIVYIQ